MKTFILAAIAVVTLGIGVSTMANAATTSGSPFVTHVSEDNGQG